MSHVHGTTTVAVRVHARASVARRSWDGQTLAVWVVEPPANGAANDAVIKAVAQWLHVPRSAVSLRSGRSARIKLIAVDADVELPAPDTRP